jgi:hypothetical protein
MMKPIAPIRVNPMVLKLIDEMAASWKEDLIRLCFLSWDASTILSIHVPTRRHSNLWAWNFDQKGLFSARFAYGMMINTKTNSGNYFDGNLGSSNVESEAKGWSSLWKTIALQN